MNLREAAQQALEALEVADSWGTWYRGSKAITALRAALAEDAMQRKPLTDEEIKAVWFAVDHSKIGHTIDFVRAIERAHGIGGDE